MKKDPRQKSPFPAKKPGAPSPADAANENPFPTKPLDLATFQRQAKSYAPKHSREAETIAPPSSEQPRIPPLGKAEDPFADGLPDEVEFDSEGRVTITNEVELETARLQSSLLSSLPPPRQETPGLGTNLLSMANAQAPTVPPPPDYDSSAKMRSAKAAPLPIEDTPDNASIQPTGEGPTVDPIVEMRERFSLGDYTGALQIAEALLQDDPTNPEVLECSDDCRAVLIKMYTARIGPLDKVPVVMVPRHQLRWLSIDHRAGFVLSHIDGMSSLEMILDVSGMPPLDALRILYELVQQRIIAFR